MKGIALEEVNELRLRLNAKPLSELPKGQKERSQSPIARCFHDIDPKARAYPSHISIHGKSINVPSGLREFIYDFEDGKYPELLET